MTIYIYSLSDPFTGQIRYIGKSTRPEQRLQNHCNDKSKCHRVHWIRSVIAQGGKPILGILEELLDGANWQEAERKWIAYGYEQGWPLTNGTSGGDGVCDLAPESRARITAAWIGRKHKPESLTKIGAASKGRYHTEEYKLFMRDRMRVRDFTPEHRARIAAATMKLTHEQILDVLDRIANGEQQKHVAESYGVHRTTIQNICKNRYHYVSESEFSALPLFDVDKKVEA